jgi:hypothetical protein
MWTEGSTSFAREPTIKLMIIVNGREGERRQGDLYRRAIVWVGEGTKVER